MPGSGCTPTAPAMAQEPPRAKTSPLPPAKARRRLLAMARAAPRHNELIGPRPLSDPLSMHSRHGPSSRACSPVPATARVPVPARVTRSELKRQRAREAAQLSGAGHSRAARVRAAQPGTPANSQRLIGWTSQSRSRNPPIGSIDVDLVGSVLVPRAVAGDPAPPTTAHITLRGGSSPVHNLI